MSANSEKIILFCTVAGTALAVYAAWKASQPAQVPAQVPQAAAQSNAAQYEQWFATLWGAVSSGGTPEAATSHPA